MKKHPTLRRQLLYLFLPLFLVVQAALIYANLNVSRDTVEIRIRAELDQTVQVFENVIRSRSQELADRSQVLAQDFGFRQAVATGDAPTIRSALVTLEARADSDITIMLDKSGRIIAQTTMPDYGAMESDFNTSPLISDTPPDFIVYDGTLFQVAIVPVKAPVLVGWIILGKELNSGEAANIQKYSPAEMGIAFLYRDDGWKIPGATASDTLIGQFLSVLDASSDVLMATGQDETLTVQGDKYFSRFVGL